MNIRNKYYSRVHIGTFMCFFKHYIFVVCSNLQTGGGFRYDVCFLIYAQLHVFALFIVIVFTDEYIFDNSYLYNFDGIDS